MAVLRTWVGLMVLTLGAAFTAAEEQPLVEMADMVTPMTPENVAALADRVKKSVVVVSFSDRDGKTQGFGSGFIVREDGLIATNLHVLGEARAIQVRLLDGTTYPVETIYAHEKSLDLALIQINASGLPKLELGDSDKLVQGQPVVALGNPLGLEHSVVAGVVSGLRQDVEGMSMIQLAMPIEQGNSGGPLVDLEGRVQGLLTLKSLVTQNLGYAVTINSLKPLLEKPNPVTMSQWLTIGAVNPRHWTVPGDVRWTQRAGRIRVQGQGTGFGGRSLCLSTKAVPNIPFEVGVSVKIDPADGAAGLVLFHQGDAHYGFYPSSGKLRFTRFDGPTVYEWQVLWEEARPEYREGEWNHLKIRVEADRLKCYCNDQLVHEEFDDDLRSGTAGLAKFRHTTADFKEFILGAEVPSHVPDPAIQQLAEAQTAKLAHRPPTAAVVDDLLKQPSNLHEALEIEARQLEDSAKRLRQLSLAVHETRTRQALQQALTGPEEQIDLARAALLIAALDNRELRVEDSLATLDDLAGEIKAALPTEGTDAEKLAVFHRCLFEEQGFHGSRVNYYNASNSYLNETIDDREGLPITLSVVYMTLARRVGLKVEGVGLPGHFIVRYVPMAGDPVLIDPFDRGRQLTLESAQSLVTESGRTWDETALTPQTAQQIVIRIMRNLLALANDASDAEAALRYTETILTLDPESSGDLVMKAVLCFNTDRLDEALAATQLILKNRPPDVLLDRVQRLQWSIEQRMAR